MKTMRYPKILALALALLNASAYGVEKPRVVVDTTQMTLTVFRGSETLAVFDNIAIGRGGVTHGKRHLDDKTPLGTFHIARINYDSPFHLFFGFDYPSVTHAARALEAGWITWDVYRAIARAAREGRLPPQDTALGGYLGIHGVGEGDPRVHRRFNWTEGCIALTNEQINQLDRWVGIGTTVIVR